MLPRMCAIPPCRNIDTTIEVSGCLSGKTSAAAIGTCAPRQSWPVISAAVSGRRAMISQATAA